MFVKIYALILSVSW